ncbi:hypothetical protein, partial [Blastomonas sp.]|uniref:Gldg family protein n=1 Tax=Blastomonas sp. TaxID=1909299 RepID=UPI0035945151
MLRARGALLRALLPLLLIAGCHSAAADPEPLLPDLPVARIALMSSLPLVYGDAPDVQAVIAGEGDPHPFYLALNDAHQLVVLDALLPDALGDIDLLILIQPRALAPEGLVALDGFVRGGGRALIFTDPDLQWESGLGFGDPRGPLRSGLLAPLLAHWGLEMVDPELGAVTLPKSGATLVKPGQFTSVSGKTGDGACTLAESAQMARCTPGAGRAILVADADLLDPDLIAPEAAGATQNRRFIAGLVREL